MSRLLHLKDPPSSREPPGTGSSQLSWYKSKRDGHYDNAFMESCFGTMKTELQLEDYASDAEAKREIGQYVDYYNHRRLHSSLGYLTPSEFERQPPQPETGQNKT
ncbi:MAG: integrase core domain-containing protein [Pseudomonadota bacterium]